MVCHWSRYRLTAATSCSHKLQPLDVGVFGAFKRFYSSICNDWHLSNPGETITIYYVGELPGKALQNLSQWKTFFRRLDALAYFP